MTRGIATAILAFSALVACGGSSAPPAAPLQSSAGIWSGEAVDTATGVHTPLIGASLPSGETSLFANQDCHVYAGNLAITGDRGALTGVAIAKDICYGDQDFVRLGWTPNVPGYGVFETTIQGSGTISTRSAMSLSYRTGTGNAGNIAMRFWDLYDRPAALVSLAGTYANGARLSITIAADGSFSGTEITTPLLVQVTNSYSGQLRVIDPAKNLYRVSITRNAYTYTGFAYLADSAPGKANDAVVIFARQSGGGNGALVHYWIRV